MSYIDINYGSEYYKKLDQGLVELNQIIFLDNQGINGSERYDELTDCDQIGIRLKMVIPEKMFEFPTITVKIPEEYTRDDKVLSSVEEIEIPIKFEKDGGEISVDTKIASKERGFISLVMKKISEAFDPDN